MDDAKIQDLMLRALNENSSKEAILVPTMFTPPIMLSNIFRVGLNLKSKGYTTAPTRRLGGWHFRLLAPGIAYCQTPAVPAAKPGMK